MRRNWVFLEMGIVLSLVLFAALVWAVWGVDADQQSPGYPGPTVTSTWDCPTQYLVLEKQWAQLLAERDDLRAEVSSLKAQLEKCVSVGTVDPDMYIGH